MLARNGTTSMKHLQKPKLQQAYDYKNKVTARNNLRMLQRQQLDTIDQNYSGKFHISLSSLGISSHPGTREYADDGKERFSDTIKVPLYVSKDTSQNLTTLDEALVTKFVKERSLPLEKEAPPPPQKTDMQLSREAQAEAEGDPGSVKVCAILPRNVISVDSAEKAQTIHRSDVLVPDAGTVMNFTIDTMPLTAWQGVVREVVYTGGKHSGRRVVFITMENVAGSWIRSDAKGI